MTDGREFSGAREIFAEDAIYDMTSLGQENILGGPAASIPMDS
jgi:hypothetical protein